MFSDPQKNVAQMGLTPGMRIADLGAGSGFYALEAARAVGDSGRVYAIDIQKDLLAKLRNKAREEHLGNIEVIWADLEHVGGTRIQDGAVHGVIVSNILFQIQNKDNVCQEIKRILRPRGLVYLVDWADSFGGLGPHGSQIVTEKSARELFLKNGFTIAKSMAAGDHHYGLVFEKK